ncbi:hypothetical protein C4565_10580 [Candidatus Parcubacteria bacterium]|nr:MAG: hypothetical protein C4565_10580 [Candidatus Parcubacteria bacterium]
MLRHPVECKEDWQIIFIYYIVFSLQYAGHILNMWGEHFQFGTWLRWLILVLGLICRAIQENFYNSY